MFEVRDPIFEEENQKKLIEQIQNAPDCKIYGVSKFDQRTIHYSMILSVSLAFILITIVLLFYNPIISIILLALIIIGALISFAISSYMNYSHNYFKIYVSGLGIAKNSKWGAAAIPWENIEYIEIKNKGSDIDYIIFRSGTVTLGYRNSHFVTRFTIDILSEYIRGIDSWYILAFQIWTNGTRRNEHIGLRAYSVLFDQIRDFKSSCIIVPICTTMQVS